MAKLDTYVALLAEWQGRMNLVAPSTLPAVWDRHIRDSAQIARLAPKGGTWLDIGAGAGFPGLVLATLGAGRIRLVESVGKKARFLRAVIEALDLHDRAMVENARLESLPPQRHDVITARACAPLTQLFDWGLRFAAQSTLWLLPKGAAVEDELAAARQRFAFDAELVPSLTDARGRIVVARGVKRR